MTPAKAAGIRSLRISGKQLSNREQRQQEQIAKEAATRRSTIDRLWSSYKTDRPDIKGIQYDEYRYNKHIKSIFGEKEPVDILEVDVDRLRITLGKTKSPQTVKHVLILLDRIVNYGVKKGLCSGLTFKVKKPLVQNIKTEDLTDEQIQAFLEAIENDGNLQVGALLKMALFTGMRRGEIFKLRWDDIDFRRGVISIKDPKGKQDQIIPMNELAKKLLEQQLQSCKADDQADEESSGKVAKRKSSFVFPTDDGKQRRTVQNQVRRIREAAGLPKDFRPFHGLRHVFASMLASSGKVDMYTLQKLLTHKSPLMTQRYAHLRDETTKRATGVAGDIIGAIMQEKSPEIIEEK